ncbi:MAG: MarR family winged helix-turn-helix transcriptional regulator [Stellaceae bacterium]
MVKRAVSAAEATAAVSRDPHDRATPVTVRSACPWQGLGPLGDGLDVVEFPTFLLERAASLARKKLTRSYLDRWRLGLPEWRLLNVVARLPVTSFAEIARVSTMDKAQISLTLRTLAARGWVAVGESGAVRSVGARRPARAITLTAQGRAMIRKVLPDARRAQMRVLDALDDDERDQLYRLLRKAVVILDSLEDEGARPAPRRRRN